MLIYKSQLHAVHVVREVLAVLAPDHQSLVLDVTMLEVRFAQRIVLRLGRGLLFEAIPLVLQFFALRDLGFENGSCGFKLFICVAKFDCVEALLEKTFAADTLDVGDERFFASEELVFAALFAPVLPRQELAAGHLLSLLLDRVLERQEDTLFETRHRYDLAEHLVLLAHVFLLDGGNPLHKSLPLRSKRPPIANAPHEVLLS